MDGARAWGMRFLLRVGMAFALAAAIVRGHGSAYAFMAAAAMNGARPASALASV